ncbi:Heavy metal RND efflux outer membrane protein, CzcC family [hydrothermal vent metagenome]|uniref:Heavy metal RND efflux outer membrane protein, CzcC family n=1 Tax=hydrothermal vent metagenome TaxID=652676 RepID=A0A3B0ZFW4_9ZZZZ
MWVSFFMPRQAAVRSTAFCLVLVSSIANASVAAASDSKTKKHTINLHEAVIKTIAHNPNLRAFDYQLKAQQGRMQQAGLAPSPELSFQLEDVLGTGNNKGVDSAQATLSIGWVLERGIRQRYVDVAHAGSSLVEVEADIKQLNAAAETARRYLVSLAFQAREVNAVATIQLAEETIKSVAKRVKAGKTPEAELSRAQAELARRKLERKAIEHQLLSANRRLAAQWGETILTFARLEGDITHLPQMASFEILKSQLPQNPEFARLLSDQLLKKAELQLALAQDKPNWRINAGIRHNNNNNDQAFVAGISIPFGERTRNPGRITEARANLAKTNREEHAARISIETVLFVMYEKLQYSLHVIETLRGEIIPPLEQALTETRRAYNLGRYSYLELRSVQAELLDAHNALVEASIDAHRNIIEIERLTGVRIAQSATLSKHSNPRGSQ